MEEKEKDALRFLMPFPDRHKRETTPGAPAQTGKGGDGGRKWVRPVVFLLIIGTVAVVAMTWRGMKAEAATARAQSRNTAPTERRGISSELPSSGALKAEDTYSIASMVEGEVLSAGFGEGDQVERDRILYEIDKSSMESQLANSVNSLTRSQSSYEDILGDYNNTLNDYSGDTYKAADTGHIKELYISVGGKMSGNTKLTDMYSNDIIEIRIPFLSGKAVVIGAGMPTAVALTDTGKQVAETVKAMANQEAVLTGGRLMRIVTIQVPNPDGLTVSLKATVQIGEFIGSEDGVFEASVDTTINTNLSTSVEVGSLLINVGDYVTRETPVFKITDKSTDKLIQSYKDALGKAEENVESAQSKLDSTQDNYDSCTIKAPTSGQAITKNFKMGDNITRNGSSTMVLVTIHDLSSPTFEISIDELDIKEVEVGQKVEVSADAFERQTFSGTVTNVSLESAYSSGVSTYPVTVTLDDMGDLLPGMNMDGVITLGETNDVLAIPADTLMRGNQVYVKDNTATKQQGPIPIGFRAVEVETGLTSDTFVEIKSGLSEGDVVYMAESSKNSNSVIMVVDGDMGDPPGEGKNMGDGNRGGSERGRQDQ